MANANKSGQKMNAESGANADQKMTGGMTGESCGSARNVNDIQPHMEVISSCGCKMGKVDHLEGDTIKLTKNDSPDGQHHFVPTGWVARVDEHVHLSKDADETKREWKPDAASCANIGA